MITLELSDQEAYILELALDDVAEVYRSDKDIQVQGYAPMIRRVQERLQKEMVLREQPTCKGSVGPQPED